MLSAAHTWSLTAIAIASGITMLWVFARLSDAERIELARRKIRANLYAFRLFAAEPALIFRAQRQLLLWNARYLRLMLGPSLVTLIPAVILLIQLEAIYGNRPLRPGEATMVTAQFDTATDLHSLVPSLEGRGVSVETTAVRIPDQRQACWRVRAISDTPGSVWLGAEGAARGKLYKPVRVCALPLGAAGSTRYGTGCIIRQRHVSRIAECVGSAYPIRMSRSTFSVGASIGWCGLARSACSPCWYCAGVSACGSKLLRPTL